MKKKLTVTIDADVLPRAKRYAHARRISLSQLIEAALREAAAEGASFSQRWRGKFRPAGMDGERYETLARKHL